MDLVCFDQLILDQLNKMEIIQHNDFSRASAFFAEEVEKMFRNKTYHDIDLLLIWSVQATEKTLSISDACGSAHVALTLSDRLSILEEENYFSNIIERCSELGIHSEVQTESLKYKAAVVISMYIDSNLN